LGGYSNARSCTGLTADLPQTIIALYEHNKNNKEHPVVSASIVKTELTGVDRNTEFALSFPTLGAQAMLSCSINLPPVQRSATIRFRKGNIIIPAPLPVPREYTVQWFDKPGSGVVHREETVCLTYEGKGMHFQADEVARCVREGKLGSDLWSHDKTVLEMKIFDEVRQSRTCFGKRGCMFISYSELQVRRQGGYKLSEGVERVV